jgi:hypothetical protein
MRCASRRDERVGHERCAEQYPGLGIAQTLKLGQSSAGQRLQQTARRNHQPANPYQSHGQQQDWGVHPRSARLHLNGPGGQKNRANSAYTRQRDQQVVHERARNTGRIVLDGRHHQERDGCGIADQSDVDRLPRRTRSLSKAPNGVQASRELCPPRLSQRTWLGEVSARLRVVPVPKSWVAPRLTCWFNRNVGKWPESQMSQVHPGG